MGLTYNGIDLGSYLLTRRVSQGPVYDPSGTDQLYTRIHLQVQSVINPSLNPATGGETPTETAARIRHMLTSPRKALVYSVGANNYIDLPGGLDDANGPKPDPEAFTIQEVTPDTFVVSWSCTVCLTDCAAASQKLYLSNRWSESATMDRDWITTKRRTGTLILSSRSGIHPDDFRGVVAPALEPGFRRESAHYQVSEDNLTVHYTFIDRELHRPPPFPALEMRGQMVETVPISGGGVLRRGEINLQLKGPKGSKHRDLLNVAIAVAMARVRSSGVIQTSTGKMFIGGAVSESLNDDETAVGLNVQWQMKPGSSRESGKKAEGNIISDYLSGGILGVIDSISGRLDNATRSGRMETEEGKKADALSMNANWVGASLEGSGKGWPVATPTRGTAETVKLAAAALNDPCFFESILTTSVIGNESVLTSADGRTTVTPSDQQPDDEGGIYQDNQPGVWDHWELTYRYESDTGFCGLPAAKHDGSAAAVRVHGGMLTLAAEWHLKRTGGAPERPDMPESRDTNWIYMGGTICPKNLDVASDGVSLIYEVSGVWNFLCIDRKKAKITYPVPPWLALPGQVQDLSSGVVSNPIHENGEAPVGVGNVIGGAAGAASGAGTVGQVITGIGSVAVPPVN